MVPSFVKQEVEIELQLIADHKETLLPSPVMNMGNASAGPVGSLKEDYTQYLPRRDTYGGIPGSLCYFG
ncbi:MAG: hypothetical protein PHG06_20895 [Parabacteroides sp.]|nr:hypothetical protein [Parabacteroides sp.]